MSGAAETLSLVAVLASHGQHRADNDIVHLLTLGPAPCVAHARSARFRHSASFIGPNVRAAAQEGRAHVALIQSSPPDAHGYVSLGVSVDIVCAAVDCAELVLAEHGAGGGQPGAGGAERHGSL